MKKKYIFVNLFMFFIVSLFSISAYAEGMVGYINLRRLVNESEMGKIAKKDLIKLKEEKEAVLRVKLREIEELRSVINKNNDDLDSDEMRKKSLILNRRYKEYQRLEADAKEDITIGDNELVAKILKEADNALKKVAKKKKYTMIIKDPDAVGYLDPSVDITDEVLKELNK